MFNARSAEPFQRDASNRWPLARPHGRLYRPWYTVYGLGLTMRALSVVFIAALTSVPPAFAQDPPAPAGIVAPAQMVDLSATETFNGRLEADQRVDLRARVSGTVLEIAFEAGDLVEEGQVLFRIEDTAYRAAVQEAEGALKSAEAQIELARLERDRQQELVNRQTGPQARLDEAEAALGNSEGVLIRQQASLERARLNLSYTEVTAPFSGRIGIAVVDEGALVSPETGALATLTDLDPIHADFSVSTADLLAHRARVAAGEVSNEASVSLIMADGTTYGAPGDIDFVDAAVDAGTDTVTLRAQFPNEEAILLDGELVRVVLTASEAQTVLGIPQRAVQRDLQGAFVMVVDSDSAVEVRRVEVDQIVDGLAAIDAGLDVGEMVITDGLNKVRPGVVVDAATAEGG